MIEFKIPTKSAEHVWNFTAKLFCVNKPEISCKVIGVISKAAIVVVMVIVAVVV